MLGKFINLRIFFITFLIGLACVRFFAQPTETILVYPTPSNAGKHQYIDRAGNCFVYGSKGISCPKIGAKKIPIQ